MKTLLSQLTPARHAEVRAAYYKAAEGLAALKESLEAADADLGIETELLTEHYRFAKIEELLSRSDLGKHL